MDIENMTPDELREYAAEKERRREELTARYMGRPAKAPGLQLAAEPWERDIEFEGETYRVDMRRVKSREFIRRFGAVQRHQQRGEEIPIDELLGLYDYLFSGKVDDRVVEVVTAKMGYEDFEEISRIENALLEAIDLKN